MRDVSKGNNRSRLLWAVVDSDTEIARSLVAANPALLSNRQSSDRMDGTHVRSRTGRALALHLLALIGPGGWAIESNSQGRPIARGTGIRHVSISHTGKMIAAAVSAIGPVGIDIEHHKIRDISQLAAAAYGPQERAMVRTQGMTAFYRIWTVREAISKATGDGFVAVVDGLDRVPTEMSDGKWTIAHDNCLVAHDLIGMHTSLALAIHASSSEIADTLQTTEQLRQSRQPVR